MLNDGPPEIVFRRELDHAVSQLTALDHETVVLTLRDSFSRAASSFAQPRNEALLDRVRERLGLAHKREFRDRDIAHILGISSAAMSNFRKAKETSSRVRGFIEAVFHGHCEPAIHPKYEWLYTKLLAIEHFSGPISSGFGVFIQCQHLSREYDTWNKLVHSHGIQGAENLMRLTRRTAHDELNQLRRYDGRFSTGHLKQLGLRDDIHKEFIRIGPWCLALDLRLHRLVAEVSAHAV